MCSQNRAGLHVVNLLYILQHTDGKFCGEPQSRKGDRRHYRGGGVLFYLEWPWESSEDDLWAKTRVGWAGPMAPWMNRITDRRRRHWWGQRVKAEQGREGTSTGKKMGRELDQALPLSPQITEISSYDCSQNSSMPEHKKTKQLLRSIVPKLWCFLAFNHSKH